SLTTHRRIRVELGRSNRRGELSFGAALPQTHTAPLEPAPPSLCVTDRVNLVHAIDEGAFLIIQSVRLAAEIAWTVDQEPLEPVTDQLAERRPRQIQVRNNQRAHAANSRRDTAADI